MYVLCSHNSILYIILLKHLHFSIYPSTLSVPSPFPSYLSTLDLVSYARISIYSGFLFYPSCVFGVKHIILCESIGNLWTTFSYSILQLWRCRNWELLLCLFRVGCAMHNCGCFVGFFEGKFWQNQLWENLEGRFFMPHVVSLEWVEYSYL